MENLNVGQSERKTQARIIALFQKQLNYKYLGNWIDRDNSNIEEDELKKFLANDNNKHSEFLIARVLDKIHKVTANYSYDLYTSNKEFYSLLRYGVDVSENIGENKQKIHLIDWHNPENNRFAIAEEVTVHGNRDKRPDIVLYINGIALGVLELKRSTVFIGEGIRQSIVNQQKKFIQSFFTTMQFIFAGNDTEGLRYGTVTTPGKYFLTWKENEQDQHTYKLDKHLIDLCNKTRFLDLIYNFIVFDGGRKKLPRANQYFGVKAAQEFVRRREGGIIWHTQGSGKSLSMVWLAKWILANNPHARVVIITDRVELDKQISGVFHDINEDLQRTSSGKKLIEYLNNPLPRLFCSLIHKFKVRGIDNFDAYIEELRGSPSNVVGELFIFVDECHRTESGKMHKAMKAILKNAVFIGFTGTPLLKQDQPTSREVFGRYIHTYKFNEAVADKVVLDLLYEARDVDTKLTSGDKVDLWFEAKTRGLNDFQKRELKKTWGTMQKVLSSKSRMEKIVQDIILDFNTKTRLISDSGNAILVAGRIYEAARYYEILQNTPLRDRCALITSYNPTIQDITTEDTGENTESEKEFVYQIYTELLQDIVPESGKTKSETYEDKAKDKFKNEPANMKLLIVVDKLLVGFDAPPCTYLYLDKKMQDHGLFQAICRVNRLDTDDKAFGYIIDYKDLFKKLEGAYSVYASELDYTDCQKQDVDILIQDRLQSGKRRLDCAIENLAYLCEPVSPPKDTLAYIHYFCGNTEDAQDLKNHELKRNLLYKHITELVRAYTDIAGELEAAGYDDKQAAVIKNKVNKFLQLREEIRMASGEKLDLKAYEADMRYLIDTYIQAEDSRRIDSFYQQSLLEIMVKNGVTEAINTLPTGIKNSQEATAETIENNVRTKIMEDYLTNPAYFENMSKLLDEVIKERKVNAISYEEYLRKVADIAKKTTDVSNSGLPPEITTKALRVLYDNLNQNAKLAIDVDNAVYSSRRADWRGNPAKEQEIKQAVFKVLESKAEVEKMFQIIKEQNEY